MPIPLNLPLGLQLYSVRQQMTEDLEGALAAVSKADYTNVEAAALPKLSAPEMRSTSHPPAFVFEHAVVIS